MKDRSKLKIKIGIMSFSLLMMGAVGISSALAVIGAHFSGVSQTKIQMLISITTFIILFSSLLAGKLQEYIAKKYIVIIGCILFVVGGVLPFFAKDFNVILLFRVIFGIGCGFVQPMSSAIIEENFSGHERDKMMGLQASMQQCGSSLINFTCGELGTIGWNYAFLPHLIGLIPLLLVPFLLPAVKPDRFAIEEKANKLERKKVKLTKGAIFWAATNFFAFMSAQANSIYGAYFLAEQGFGNSATAGRMTLVSSGVGFLTGLVLGKYCQKTKRFSFVIAMSLLMISDLMTILAKSVVTIWISKIFVGAAFAMFIPIVVMNAASSVDAYSKPMAIAITTCTKSLSQIICPFVVAFFAVRMDKQVNMGAYKFMTYYLVVLVVIYAVIATVQTIQDKKKAKAAAGQTADA